MLKRCAQANCHAPEVTCTEGELNFERCEYWRSSNGVTTPDASIPVPEAGGIRLPWTGNAFGSSDVSFVAGCSSARVVAVMGAESAGKTSMLSAWYLLIHRGQLAFAGSYTLEGWENIAASLRWSTPRGPSFPAHTSSGAGRHPGLLHLSIKQPSGSRQELLFADAPGEWFTRWAVNKEGADAQGAQWLSNTADVLLIVADSDALSGPQRGPARSQLLALLNRVGAERCGRGAALVWTKCDKEVPAAISSAVRAAAAECLGPHEEFHVSLHPKSSSTDGEPLGKGQGLMKLFSWVTMVSSRNFMYPEQDEPQLEDPIMMFGRAHG
jgi:hypothetical protein